MSQILLEKKIIFNFFFFIELINFFTNFIFLTFFYLLFFIKLMETKICSNLLTERDMKF